MFGTKKKTTRNDVMKELAQNIADIKTREYVIHRLLPIMQWYANSASKNMRIYRCWSVSSLFISASIPVVSLFSSDELASKVVIASLGAVVTFIGAILMLYDAKSVWVSCRDTREILNSIFYQYYTGKGIFSECKNQEECDKKLIDVSEEIINSEVQKRMSNYAKLSN